MTMHFTTGFWRRLKSGAADDPVRDWLVLITVGGVLLIGSIVWNIWAFDTVANGGVIGGANTGPAAPFDRSSLDTVRSVFQNRSTEAAKYQTGVYRYADPSQ